MMNNQVKLRKSVSLLLVVAISLLSSTVFAQSPKNVVVSLSKSAITNLKTGIVSENRGLRKSSIYFAGKYSVKETSEQLLSQMEIEADPELKILIMRVLYIIGNDEYMNQIHRVASRDHNIKVRKMASALYTMMQVNDSFNVADVNK